MHRVDDCARDKQTSGVKGRQSEEPRDAGNLGVRPLV